MSAYMDILTYKTGMTPEINIKEEADFAVICIIYSIKSVNRSYKLFGKFLNLYLSAADVD